MRIFIATFATETNTFAPFPTGLDQYESNGVRRDASLQGHGPFSIAMKQYRRLAEAGGHEVVESISAWAQPSGKTTRSAYEHLRDTILDGLRAAGEIDVVLLMLHGAMVAEGYDDCESDVIVRIRQIAPKAVIGVELDPHCHLTQAMVREADLVVLAKEYPHIDFGERAEDLIGLAVRTAAGEIDPVAALVDCRMVGFYPTFDPPMQQIVAELRAVEKAPPILSASIAHGFPWADVADVGTRILVYADGDPEAAAAQAEAFARRLYDARHELLPDYPEIAASLDKARGLNGTVVLGDFADNPGGGAPGDSTFFLREMLARNLSDAVVGCFWDPLAASLCANAGVGAVMPVRLGGKCGPTSGDPLDLVVEVMGVSEDHSQGVFGARQPLGRSVWIRAGQVDIVVCTIRSQVFEPDAFTGLGIDLTGKRLIVVKSSNHYRAGFDGLADHLWHVRSPGTMTMDFAALPHTKRAGPFFPRVADPWAEGEAPRAELFSRNRRPVA